MTPTVRAPGRHTALQWLPHLNGCQADLVAHPGAQLVSEGEEGPELAYRFERFGEQA
jgi:hypothetical protein